MKTLHENRSFGRKSSSNLTLVALNDTNETNFVVYEKVEVLTTEGIDVFANHILNFLDFEDIIRLAMTSKNIFLLLSLRIKPTRIVTNRRISSIKAIKHWISGSCLLTFVCRNVVVSDEDINLFPQSLTVLDLGFDQKLTNNAIKNLPRNLTQLKLCHAAIGNAGLSYLPPYLTHLTLKHSNKVTDLGLKYLPSTLTHLDLYSNTSITDKGLQNLPPNLTHLCLHENNNITSDGLKHLPQSLIYLDLNGSIHIDDDGVKYLPRSITYLDLHNSRLLTDNGLPYLPLGLNFLDLYSNKKISPLGIKQLPQSLYSFYARCSKIKIQ